MKGRFGIIFINLIVDNYHFNPMIDSYQTDEKKKKNGITFTSKLHHQSNLSTVNHPTNSEDEKIERK